MDPERTSEPQRTLILAILATRTREHIPHCDAWLLPRGDSERTPPRSASSKRVFVRP
jgi:hypothetical protein